MLSSFAEMKHFIPSTTSATTSSPSSASSSKIPTTPTIKTSSSIDGQLKRNQTNSGNNLLNEDLPIIKEPLKIQINTNELTEIITSTSNKNINNSKNNTPNLIRQRKDSDDSDDAEEDEDSVNNNRKQKQEEDQEEDSLIDSVKTSLWEFGTTMLDVEESIDKFLR